jgi:hypothetical protein
MSRECASEWAAAGWHMIDALHAIRCCALIAIRVAEHDDYGGFDWVHYWVARLVVVTHGFTDTCLVTISL